jgi:hypothetical protein
MSAHVSRDQSLSGFPVYESLMLIVALTTAVVMFFILRDPVPKLPDFAGNIHDDTCSNIFVESDFCTNFLLRGSLAPDSSPQVNDSKTARNLGWDGLP